MVISQFKFGYLLLFNTINFNQIKLCAQNKPCGTCDM